MFGSLLLSGAVAMAALSAAPSDDAVPAVDRALVDRAANAAERALPKGRRIRLEATSEWHRAPDGAEHIDPKIPPYVSDQHLLSMWGDRDRCERLLFLNAQNSYIRVFADGFLYQVALSENDGTVDEKPIHDADNIGLGLLLQIDVPAMLGGSTSVADTIRHSTVLAAEETESRVSLRYVPAGAQEQMDRIADERKIPRMKAWVYGVTLDTAEPARLVETWMEIPGSQRIKPDGTKEEIKPRIDRWAVTDWQTVGEGTIAGVVRRTLSDPRDGREIVQLIKLAEAEAIPSDVPPPPVLPEGTRIEDAKRNFHFTIGSREIKYQGRSLKLKEPLSQHPGARLDELIASAEAR